MSNSNRRSKSYRFSGNRKDPLNLNELIRRKNQSTIHHHHCQISINGKDRPVEILLPPNIYDPLGLDDQIDAQRVPQ